MRTNAPPFPRLPRRLLGRLLTTTALATVAAVTFTGGQLQPLASADAVPAGATLDAPAFDAAKAAQIRAAQCRLTLAQRKGGQELKGVARAGLNGNESELLNAADVVSQGAPLGVAYEADLRQAISKGNELLFRHQEWEKSLNVTNPVGYTQTGFQQVDPKDNPFDTTGLRSWLDGQVRLSQHDAFFSQNQAPLASAESVAAVTQVATTRYTDISSTDYAYWERWKTDRQYMEPQGAMYADDARLFLQYGGFPTSAPAPDTMEFRIDVEALKARFASCTTSTPYDPQQVLGAEIMQASAEWQDELSGQAAPRDTIMGAEKQASADLQVATQALGEALGQSIIASRLADWQAYWLKQPTSAQRYPTAADFAKVKVDIVKAQAMALGRVHVASRAAQSAQQQATTAIAAQQSAYGIADAAGLPRGRGLLYGQQAVQVARASAAAALAVAKATETASNATRASASDSKTLMALAQTQAHASAAEFRRIAAQEAAAQAKAAADGAALQATKAAENATKAKAAQAKAEAAEQTAKTAAADAHAKRLTAEAERDKAKTQKEIAATERQKAADANARAQTERTTAAEKLSAAQTAGTTAATKKEAALTAERNAISSRNDALNAEGRRDALGAKAAAKEAKADADEGTDAAADSRTAATQARTDANAATTAATNARAAANDATNAAANAREAATKAEAAASRAKAASDGAQRDVKITNAAVTKAHAAAADAIGYSEAAAENVRAAKALADTAQAKAAEAHANAVLARVEANAAAVSAVQTAGFAYATAQAALAARDSAAQVINPANDAVELGSPYKETDASAGLAVLTGQAAKTAAQQQEALAQAKANQAGKAATEAAALAAAADADAKAAATAASAAAASAVAAVASLGQARASAAEASKAAAAAVKAEANTVEYNRQATADAAAATAASTEAAGYATEARSSATAAEQDATSARGAATAAEADAATARGIADQAEKDATAAEASATRAQQDAKEAQEAAERAEVKGNNDQIKAGTTTGVGNVFYVPNHIEQIGEPEDVKTDNCNPIFHTGDCTVTETIHFTAFVDLYQCTDEDSPATQLMCPPSALVFLGSATLTNQKETVTRTLSMTEFNSGIDPVKIVLGDFIECAQKLVPGGDSGSWTGCAWAATWFVGGKALKVTADAVKALDAAMRTGIGVTDAWKGLRAAGLTEAAIEGIGAKILDGFVTACTRRNPLRAAAVHSGNPCEGIIAYGSTDLALMAYKGRMGSGVTAGRNVAVAKVPGWNDPKTGDLVVGFSKGDGYHSENHILDQLAARNFKPSQITELYSDRKPCPVCSPLLEDVLTPGTPIFWAVPDGPGSAALLKNMIQRFGGRASFRTSVKSDEE
ncbi:nucleic acid/nucleotide deaminase domain-containing protein [Streptomyces fildesensis]|uniref:nucleic acid/nucleotide deaminase domain-containing protein n=1 Tax=Streptomyces fildesensis TaxID=375757 RepID=UPI0018DF38A7|nr:nucleic acid/nucleotide deaminase domain-containing protein [Streptomyces fildesensis]